MNSRYHLNRINILIFLNVLAVVLVAFRLFTIQVIQGSVYSEMAERQHWRGQELTAPRGKIYTSEGFPIADVQVRYLLYAQPKVISDPVETAEYLAEVLHPDIEDIEKREDRDFERLILKERYLERLKMDLYWVSLISNLTEEQKEAIEQEEIEGLGFEEQLVRYYPEGSLAAHIMGFVGLDEVGESAGYFGVEGYYDGDLRGRTGEIRREKDAQGKVILLGEERYEPARVGRDVYLTIDRSAQFLVESKVREGVDRYGAKSGTVVVMEPSTGKLIALANYPSFDPSDLTPKECDTEKDLDCEREEKRSKAVSDVYEPGSVIKALTMSAGIDSGVVTPQTTVEDEGPLQVGHHTIHNWNRQHHGVINMIEVLQLSNNVGASKLGRMIGAQTLYEYFERFNLTEPTGVDLEGEGTGYMQKEGDYIREIDLITATFGQGLTATPLQVTAAFAALVNEGKYMKPYVVDKIVDPNTNEEYLNSPQFIRRVLKRETSDVMIEMLTRTVEGGISEYLVLDSHKVAGKTGTGQIAVDGKYDLNKTNVTFVGFLPQNRDFVMLVKFEEPGSYIYAEGTAVPLWMEIAGELTTLMRIPPDK